MGMYDIIKCKYPLPIDLDLFEEEFQTKDLDNLLDNYTINEKGELILHAVEYKFVPEEERLYYGKPEWDKNFLFQLCGAYKAVSTEDKFIDFTGTINFYSNLSNENLYFINFNERTVNDKPVDSYSWIEFSAKFENGVVQEIKLVEYRRGND